MMEAVARFVDRERVGVSETIDELNEHRAFRDAAAGV
jgi:predicted N-acyltransferase